MHYRRIPCVDDIETARMKFYYSHDDDDEVEGALVGAAHDLLRHVADAQFDVVRHAGLVEQLGAL